MQDLGSLPISGPNLQARAKLVAVRLNKDFKMLNGQLKSFHARHGITFEQINGEPNDVDTNVVSYWKIKIESLIADYQLETLQTLMKWVWFSCFAK